MDKLLRMLQIYPILDRMHNVRQASSSHWSLLYLDLLNNVALHLDSHGDNNCKAAEMMTADILRLLKRECTPPVITVRCPQQGNGYDCGIFTILHAEFIADRIAAILSASNAQDLMEAELKDWVARRLPFYREKLKEDIKTLAAE